MKPTVYTSPIAMVHGRAPISSRKQEIKDVSVRIASYIAYLDIVGRTD